MSGMAPRWLSRSGPASSAGAAAPDGRGRPLVPAIPVRSSLEISELAWIGASVSRVQALALPTVACCRNEIVDAAAQLAVYRYRGDERLDPGWLLTQPDPSTTWPSTIGGTVDDLLFYGRAYWRVLARGAEGHPERARWTPFTDVTPEVTSTGGSWSNLRGYRVAGLRDVLAPDELIRFDSPNPGILTVGARTIAAYTDLEDAARRFSRVELPAGVLKNEGSELNESEAAAVVASFQAARAENSVAFLQGVSYTREALSPADLGLVEARATAATDICRLFQVPVALASASPTGTASAMTYSNLAQELALFATLAVAPHLRTVEETLTTVIPRGQRVAFDVASYLRADPIAGVDQVLKLYQAGLITSDEARGYLGIPSVVDAPDLAPGRV